nr:MAG TPA: chitin synthase regulator [Caudoviricetes sp.]
MIILPVMLFSFLAFTLSSVRRRDRLLAERR